MIDRTACIEKITNDLKKFKVCALLGPRQCGKTTMAMQYAALHKQKGIAEAIATLGLEKVSIIIPGDQDHPLSEKAQVVGLQKLVMG